MPANFDPILTDVMVFSHHFFSRDSYDVSFEVFGRMVICDFVSINLSVSCPVISDVVFLKSLVSFIFRSGLFNQFFLQVPCSAAQFNLVSSLRPLTFLVFGLFSRFSFLFSWLQSLCIFFDSWCEVSCVCFFVCVLFFPILTLLQCFFSFYDSVRWLRVGNRSVDVRFSEFRCIFWIDNLFPICITFFIVAPVFCYVIVSPRKIPMQWQCEVSCGNGNKTQYVHLGYFSTKFRWCH